MNPDTTIYEAVDEYMYVRSGDTTVRVHMDDFGSWYSQRHVSVQAAEDALRASDIDAKIARRGQDRLNARKVRSRG